MRSVKLVATGVLLLAGLCPPARAWNAPGHMLVAIMAYDKLDDGMKTKVDQTMQKHPAYARWKQDWQAILESRREAADPSLLKYYMLMRASRWPDDINYQTSDYDNRLWHFVDWPIVLSPSGELEPGGAPPKGADLLAGFQSSLDKVAHPQDPQERATYLSWLIHLTGDAHQPLHCAALHSDVYKGKRGDEGGNQFCVRVANRVLPLHEYWDDVLLHIKRGNVKDPKVMRAEAEKLQTNTKLTADDEKRLAKAGLDSKAWTVESRDVAMRNGYTDTDGKLLKSVPKSSLKVNGRKIETEKVPELSPAYQDRAYATAATQACVAAIRLQRLLEKVLDGGPGG
jgi:hypothetical protein